MAAKSCLLSQCLHETRTKRDMLAICIVDDLLSKEIDALLHGNIVILPWSRPILPDVVASDESVESVEADHNVY